MAARPEHLATPASPLPASWDETNEQTCRGRVDHNRRRDRCIGSSRDDRVAMFHGAVGLSAWLEATWRLAEFDRAMLLFAMGGGQYWCSVVWHPLNLVWPASSDLPLPASLP